MPAGENGWLLRWQFLWCKRNRSGRGDQRIRCSSPDGPKGNNCGWLPQERVGVQGNGKKERGFAVVVRDLKVPPKNSGVNRCAGYGAVVTVILVHRLLGTRKGCSVRCGNIGPPGCEILKKRNAASREGKWFFERGRLCRQAR